MDPLRDATGLVEEQGAVVERLRPRLWRGADGDSQPSAMTGNLDRSSFRTERGRRVVAAPQRKPLRWKRFNAYLAQFPLPGPRIRKQIWAR